MIFIGYPSVRENPNPSRNQEAPPKAQAKGPVRRLYRIFIWAALAVLAAVIFFILRPDTPPQIAVNPESTKRAEAKIERFQSAIGRGTEYRLEMDESELNGWLSENLALKQPAEAKPALEGTSESLAELKKIATGDQSLNPETMEQLQSSVRDVKIRLLQDALRVYALFDFHGMDLSVELEGKPLVRNGYLRLDPSGGKLGSLPMTRGTLTSVANYVFDSPQNKEKFKLLPYIQDVRIEQGRLIVISR